jgi:hypothetical protein
LLCRQHHCNAVFFHISEGVIFMKERDLTNKYLEVGDLIQRGRRAALKAGVVGLGAMAFATILSSSLLTPSLALGADNANDIKIANVALNLEHQAIAAYGVGAGTGLLEGPALAAAKLFMSHHEAHRCHQKVRWDARRAKERPQRVRGYRQSRTEYQVGNRHSRICPNA